jgi:hypothetical protein
MTNQELHDLILDRTGRANVDMMTGCEAGMQGKQRIAGKLWDRHPPDHYVGSRRDDWYAGYKVGLVEHERQLRDRTVTFAGWNGTEAVVVSRRGWSVKRGIVVTQLARQGCFGDVTVSYWQGSKIVRTINCGI